MRDVPIRGDIAVAHATTDALKAAACGCLIPKVCGKMERRPQAVALTLNVPMWLRVNTTHVPPQRLGAPRGQDDGEG